MRAPTPHQISRTAWRSATTAVLGHPDTAPGHNAPCGDVERCQPIATRADDIHQRLTGFNVDVRAELLHGPGETRDLLGAFPLHPQPHQKRGRLDIPHLSLNDQLEHLGGQIRVQVLTVSQEVKGDGHQRRSHRIQ